MILGEMLQQFMVAPDEETLVAESSIGKREKWKWRMIGNFQRITEKMLLFYCIYVADKRVFFSIYYCFYGIVDISTCSVLNSCSSKALEFVGLPTKVYCSCPLCLRCVYYM